MVETSQYERQQQFSSAIIFLSGMYFPNCSPSFLRSLRRFIDIKFPKPNVYMNTELMRPEANCKLSTYYRSLYYIVQLDIWCWWPIISPRAINDKRQRLIYSYAFVRHTQQQEFGVSFQVAGSPTQCSQIKYFFFQKAALL